MASHLADTEKNVSSCPCVAPAGATREAILNPSSSPSLPLLPPPRRCRSRPARNPAASEEGGGEANQFLACLRTRARPGWCGVRRPRRSSAGGGDGSGLRGRRRRRIRSGRRGGGVVLADLGSWRPGSGLAELPPGLLCGRSGRRHAARKREMLFPWCVAVGVLDQGQVGLGRAPAPVGQICHARPSAMPMRLGSGSGVPGFDTAAPVRSGGPNVVKSAFLLVRVRGCRSSGSGRWIAWLAFRRATLRWWWLLSVVMWVARSGRRGTLVLMVLRRWRRPDHVLEV
jgi:hypothetical protein